MNANESGNPIAEGAKGAEPRRIPFLELLDIRLVDHDKGRGRVSYVVSSQHLRTKGVAHGGMLATLLDTVMGMSAWTLAPDGHEVVTVQLNVNYIRPAWEGESLEASSEVKHAGRRTAVASSEIRTSAGALVASGSATFMYVPPSDFVPRTDRDADVESSGSPSIYAATEGP